MKKKLVAAALCAFAACGALESSVMRRYGGLAADFSERNMALFDGRDHDPSVDMHGFGSIDAGGSQSDAEAYLMRWAGPVEESADPYPSGASPAFDALAAKYGVQADLGRKDHDLLEVVFDDACPGFLGGGRCFQGGCVRVLPVGLQGQVLRLRAQDRARMGQLLFPPPVTVRTCGI